MVQVGINENLVLSKAGVTNENGKISLDLYLREKGTASNLNDFEQLSSGVEVDTGNAAQRAIKVWCPLPPKDDKTDGTNKSVAEKVKESRDNLAEFQNLLLQFMKCFTTTDKIKFNMFAGMDSVISPENYESQIVKEEIINQAFLNLANQFVEQSAQFVDKDELALRVLLVRQKTKMWPEFRRRFIKDNPVVEPASIPLAQSKLKFTKYEKDNSLDKAENLTQDDADELPISESVENLFQQPTTAFDETV